MKLKRLKDLREDNDLTQTQLSSMININQQAYSLYEKGERKIPLEILINLSLVYKTSLDYIVGITDIKQPYPRAKKKPFDTL